MILRLAAKLAWGTTKFTVKHILVPIAITAATAVVLDELADRIREGGRTDGQAKGVGTVIKPGP